MKVSGAQEGLQGVQIGSQGVDSVSRNIQRQIARLQKQMQDLSANKELGVEEKMKRRQELQKQIMELNNQLRQHQMEMRREQQQKQSEGTKEALGTKREEETQTGGISQAGMEAMISADTALKQAKVQNSTAVKLKGRAGVLEGEIKQDAGRGRDVEAKTKELSKIEQAAMKTQESQAKLLGGATDKLQESQSEDKEDDKTEAAFPKRYTKDGRPVPEEEEAALSVQV